MAGTLFGLPLSQQLDEDGDPLSGALLYVYEALTTTPADTFADSGLTSLNAFPMECDASGRVPQFWVNDGTYRARLTTAGGVEVFDEDGILAIGPSVASSGGGGGGGGGGSGDTTAVFATGDMKWKPTSGTESGWVRANGRTIGSAASGGTERASSDTQALYEFLWNNFSDALCPVFLGRGGSALLDFDADKAIGTLDMRGRGMFGLDDMGNAAAGVLVTGTPTTAGSLTGGNEKTTLIQANLPNINFSLGSLTGNVATSIANGGGVVRNLDNGDFNDFAAGAGTHNVFEAVNAPTSTLALNSGAVTFGGVISSGGSDTPATTISPGRLGSYYLKL